MNNLPWKLWRDYERRYPTAGALAQLYAEKIVAGEKIDWQEMLITDELVKDRVN